MSISRLYLQKSWLAWTTAWLYQQTAYTVMSNSRIVPTNISLYRNDQQQGYTNKHRTLSWATAGLYQQHRTLHEQQQGYIKKHIPRAKPEDTDSSASKFGGLRCCGKHCKGRDYRLVVTFWTVYFCAMMQQMSVMLRAVSCFIYVMWWSALNLKFLECTAKTGSNCRTQKKLQPWLKSGNFNMTLNDSTMPDKIFFMFSMLFL